MSTGTPYQTIVPIEASEFSTGLINLEVRKVDDKRGSWQQVDDGLIRYFRRAGFKPSESSNNDLEQGIPRGLKNSLDQILVAPGILLSRHEYQVRYSGLDLDQYRDMMTPELFKVFVRYMGMIPGNTQIDVNKIASSIG